jgi:hypothetical protein
MSIAENHAKNYSLGLGGRGMSLAAAFAYACVSGGEQLREMNTPQDLKSEHSREASDV